MYILQNRIDNIEAYEFNLKGVIYIKDSELFLDSNKLFVIEDYYEFKWGNFYHLSKNELTYLTEGNLVQIEFAEDFYFSIIDKDNRYLKVFSGGLFDQDFGIFSIQDQEMKFQTKSFIGNTLIANKLVQNDNGSILVKNVSDGKVLWNKIIEKKNLKIDRKSSETNKIEVFNFLGVYKGVLWIVLNNGFLLGLKEDSGEEIYYIGIAKNNDFEKELFRDFGHAYISDQYKLDYESGKIILLNGTSYFEIDLNAEKLKKTWKNMSETLGDIKCDMSGNDGFKFDNQFLYAYDGLKGEIIVIDRENLSLVWNYNLEIQTNDDFVLSLLRDLKVSSSQLGVLDRNQTLHIFQRENV